MQSKITLQLTFNFGDQLNNELIPKLLLKKLWMKPCAALYLFMRILQIDYRLNIQCIILIFFSMLQNLQRWELMCTFFYLFQSFFVIDFSFLIANTRTYRYNFCAVLHIW